MEVWIPHGHWRRGVYPAKYIAQARWAPRLVRHCGFSPFRTEQGKRVRSFKVTSRNFQSLTRVLRHEKPRRVTSFGSYRTLLRTVSFLHLDDSHEPQSRGSIPA